MCSYGAAVHQTHVMWKNVYWLGAVRCSSTLHEHLLEHTLTHTPLFYSLPLSTCLCCFIMLYSYTYDVTLGIAYQSLANMPQFALPFSLNSQSCLLRDKWGCLLFNKKINVYDWHTHMHMHTHTTATHCCSSWSTHIKKQSWNINFLPRQNAWFLFCCFDLSFAYFCSWNDCVKLLCIQPAQSSLPTQIVGVAPKSQLNSNGRIQA